MACFTAGGVEASLAALRDRFKLELSEAEAVEYAYTIIEQSSNNVSRRSMHAQHCAIASAWCQGDPLTVRALFVCLPRV